MAVANLRIAKPMKGIHRQSLAKVARSAQFCGYPASIVGCRERCAALLSHYDFPFANTFGARPSTRFDSLGLITPAGDYRIAGTWAIIGHLPFIAHSVPSLLRERIVAVCMSSDLGGKSEAS